MTCHSNGSVTFTHLTLCTLGVSFHHDVVHTCTERGLQGAVHITRGEVMLTETRKRETMLEGGGWKGLERDVLPGSRGDDRKSLTRVKDQTDSEVEGPMEYSGEEVNEMDGREM